MRYFITEYKCEQSKEDLKSLGLYCYTLRSSTEDWNEIATIENTVLVRRYGSIITSEELSLSNEYPNDFIDFEKFSSENEKVDSINDLIDNLKDKGIIDLSSDKLINKKFFSLFKKESNYKEISRLSTKSKLKRIIKYYNSKKNYKLVDYGGHIYHLFYMKVCE